jgi:hypothetical protein
MKFLNTFYKKIMKKKKTNPVEVEPETIVEISETQAEEVEGGGSSCAWHSCNTKTKEV